MFEHQIMFELQFWWFKGYMQAGWGFFDWLYKSVTDEKDQFMMKQTCSLEISLKEIDAANMEVAKLRFTNEEEKINLMELQTQMNKMLNWKKIGRWCFSLFSLYWYLECSKNMYQSLSIVLI